MCTGAKRNEGKEEADVNAHSFDIDHFVPQQFGVIMPCMGKVHSFSAYTQVPKRIKVPKPDVKHIKTFLQRIFDKAHLNAGPIVSCATHV